MAIRPLNSIAGFSTGDPAITIVQANGDINTINFTANGLSNLGPVGNVTITGGTTGQYLKTDGNGVLSFGTVDVSSNNAGPMPYFIPTGESYIVNENFQGLFAQTITIDGELVVDGSLIEVGIAINSSPTQIYFDDNGVPTGNAGFTFDYTTGNMAVPGNVQVKGNILPEANITYNLGSSTKRWNDIWLSNSTIYIGDSSITTDANTLVLESGSGATITVSGDANTSIIENGTSNITIDLDSDIRFGVGGTANVLVLTSNGIDYDGNLVVNGNIIANGGNLSGNIITANTANIKNSLINISLDLEDGVPINFIGNTSNSNIMLVDDDILINTGNTDLVFGGGAFVLTKAGSANANIMLADDDLLINTGNLGNLIFGGGAFVATAMVANANVSAGNVKTDHLLYANGVAWEFGQDPGGSNTQIQFNNSGSFEGSSNLTFNTATNLFTVNGNALIGGNLTVNGNLTYVNVDTLVVEDPIVILGSGPNGAPLVSNDGKDRGLLLDYYTSAPVSAFMGWDNGNAEFAFGSNVSVAGEVITYNTLGNVRAQTFIGNINATTISGSLTTATQSNITTVGTLGSLTVSGNISAGNTSAGNVLNANYLISNSGCVSINGAFLAYDNVTHAAGIFSSSAADINLGLAANITAGSTTGTTTIRGNLVVDNNVWANTGTVKGSLLTGTLTTAAQPNVTSVGTLSSLNVTGNISGNNYTANTIKTQSVVSTRSNVNVSTLTVVDSFSTTDYRTAKYVVSSQNDDGYESLEVLLIHNDINSYITVYAAINDGGGNTVTFSTGINSGNVELRATGLAGNTIIKLIGTYVPN